MIVVVRFTVNYISNIEERLWDYDLPDSYIHSLVQAKNNSAKCSVRRPIKTFKKTFSERNKSINDAQCQS